MEYKKCHFRFWDTLRCRNSLGNKWEYFLLNNNISTSCDCLSRDRRDGGFFHGPVGRKLWHKDASVATETNASVASSSEHPPCFILRTGTACSGVVSGLKRKDFYDNTFIKLIYFLFYVSNLSVKCTFQRIPVRRVPQLTPGASGSAVGSKSFTTLFGVKVSNLDLSERFSHLSTTTTSSSSISLMKMTEWFPALPLWWFRTALMVLTRPSSKSSHAGTES